MKGTIEQLRRENKKLRAENRAFRAENKLLRQKIDLLVRKVFGSKSERITPDELQMLLSGFEEKPDGQDPDEEDQTGDLSLPAPNDSQPQKRKPRGIRCPEDLKVVEEIIIPDLVQEQLEDYKEIGREVHEQLDYQPGHFFKRRTIRPKYVHKDQRDLPPIICPAPVSLMTRGLAAPGLITEILIGRYCDHLPFYRQEDAFKTRYGVEIPRKLMGKWVQSCADWLEGIYDCMKEEIRSSSYIQVDETTATYLDRDREQGKGKGYFWTYLKPGDMVLYDWHPSRSTECIRSFLGKQFEGKLSCDGYVSYKTYEGEQKGNFNLYECWMHLRRRFYEAKSCDQIAAAWVLRQIQQLYRWEKELRESRAGPSLRAAMRASHHRMVVERLFKYFKKRHEREKESGLPASSIGEALSYALNQREGLERVFLDGEVEIDTGLVENAIRPLAVGRRNWLFVGHREAGQKSAIVYSLVQTCRMLGLDPKAYLREVLEIIPHLKPEAFKHWAPYNWGVSKGLLKAKHEVAA
jgi:transposase